MEQLHLKEEEAFYLGIGSRVLCSRLNRRTICIDVMGQSPTYENRRIVVKQQMIDTMERSDHEQGVGGQHAKKTIGKAKGPKSKSLHSWSRGQLKGGTTKHLSNAKRTKGRIIQEFLDSRTNHWFIRRERHDR